MSNRINRGSLILEASMEVCRLCHMDTSLTKRTLLAIYRLCLATIQVTHPWISSLIGAHYIQMTLPALPRTVH
jgi:hypothetical protein